jgi:hypothetical protein
MRLIVRFVAAGVLLVFLAPVAWAGPRVPTFITADYTDGAFRATVASEHPRCVGGRLVRIFRFNETSGDFTLVGKDRTDSLGNAVIDPVVTPPDGDYLAIVAKRRVERPKRTIICLRASDEFEKG